MPNGDESAWLIIEQRSKAWGLNPSGFLASMSRLHEEASIRWAKRYARRRVAMSLLVLSALIAVSWGLWTYQEVGRLRSILEASEALSNCYRRQALVIPRPAAAAVDRQAQECAESSPLPLAGAPWR